MPTTAKRRNFNGSRSVNRLKNIKEKDPGEDEAKLARKMEALRLLNDKFKSEEKKGWFGNFSSFQKFYFASEIFIGLLILILTLYVIQANKKQQAILEQAIRNSKSEIDSKNVQSEDLSLQSNPITDIKDVEEAYDKDEFCDEQDCDIAMPRDDSQL